MKRLFEDAWLEVSPHLDTVLELEPQRRRAWLEDFERRAPVLAARVRSHLADLAELEEQDFLGGNAASTLAGATLAGQRFGAYTLDRPIGHGGMGTVWLAHRSDGRFAGQAAVKLLNTALVGHPSEQRFAREGNVLARLQHPNIAHLLDAGVSAGSQPYLVLEYVQGERVDRYCETCNLSIEQRITLFLDVLAAVSHAHRNLIVHRDLKPANILVTDRGVVKLLDFGVALLLPGAEAAITQLTHHGAPGLTPGYAAPEQLRGEPVTTATDVYALGFVLFVLLAGQHPASASGKTAAELMRQTLDTEMPRLSEIALDTGSGRSLRGDLDNIVAMALRKNPAERYTTVDLFAQDLRHYLAFEPVSARPRSLRYLAAMFARRHRGSVAVAIAIMIVLIGAVVVSRTQMLEAREQRDQARYESRRAEASKDFLRLLMLSDGGPARPALTVFERLERGVAMLRQQYRDDPQFSGRMLLEMAGQFLDRLQTHRAAELFEQAYDIGRQHHDLELMAYARCNRAYAEGTADVREGVMEHIEEAQRLLAQIPNPDAILQAQCLKPRAQVAQRHGDYAQADRLLKQALRILERDGSTHRPEYVAVLSDLGNLYLARNKLAEALRIEQLTAQIHDRNGRGGTTSRLLARQNIATILSAMGEPGAALAEREMINRRLHEFESSGEETVVYTINYATLLLRMARPAEALQALDADLEYMRSSGHRMVLAQALLSKGSAFIHLRRWDEADATLKEVAALVADGIGNRSTAAQVESFMARLAFARGDLESARRHCDSSLELAGYRTPKAERSLAKVLLVAAQIALAEGAAAQVEQFSRDALAIGESNARGPDTSADVGEALLRLAQGRISSGMHIDARAVLERAVRCLTNGLDANHPLSVEARNLLASIPT